MKRGTKSLLFGGHQLVLHPLFVLMGWRKAYHVWPSWRELACIIVHDWGYWGKPNMDGPEGETHPLWAARWVSRWWPPGYQLCVGHSRSLTRTLGQPVSRLCLADKLGVALMPWWLWAMLCRLSGEWYEYRANRNFRVGDKSMRQAFEGYRRMAHGLAHIRLKGRGLTTEEAEMRYEPPTVERPPGGFPKVGYVRELPPGAYPGQPMSNLSRLLPPAFDDRGYQLLGAFEGAWTLYAPDGRILFTWPTMPSYGELLSRLPKEA